MPLLNPKILFSRKMTTRNKLLLTCEWLNSLSFKWYEPLTYFSTWNILFFICTTYYPVWNTIYIVPLIRKNIAMQCALGGGYITYIHPRSIIIPYLNMELDSILLKLIDLVAHQSFFFYSIHSMYDKKNKISCLFDYIICNSPILLYSLCFSIYSKYRLRQFDIQNLFILYFLCIYLFDLFTI